MSKIVYHKNCRKHEAVSNTKRMLIALYKKYEAPFGSIYASIELTGIADLDYREIRFYVNNQLSDLHRRIGKDIEDEKESPQGYCFQEYIQYLQFAKELSKIAASIANEYPEPEQKTIEFIFKETNLLAKLREFKEYLRINPINGFRAEYRAVRPGYERLLYSLFFVVDDLEGVEKIIIKYL